MTHRHSVNLTEPLIDRVVAASDRRLLLKGPWNLRGLAVAPYLARKLASFAGEESLLWDLRETSTLDSAGAYLLWRAWGERLPTNVHISPEQALLFERLENRTIRELPPPRPYPPLPQRLLGALKRGFDHLLGAVILLGQLLLDLFHLIRHPSDIPWREISSHIHETGGRALGITALVGFLIGIVVSYLSSLQLQTLGAQIYIVNILGMSIIRELGPLLAAILVAGRSGSAMTARLGVMRVTQELDALEAMGISRSLRLILPKVVALVLALPLLVVWTDIIALLGGAISARVEMDISYLQFILKLPGAVPVANYVIGLAKGAVFGLLIALVACHFGLRIKPDTESLGNETTNSVVAAITLVILSDAVFAILFRGVGMP
ncbi:ABC transporter permease [Methylococcus sp. EFPC2]|uniref:MlaE family ABC transporter permease n=1 Tax=Methylococcus sp. EFPC2 TaxID=2812648 RepID=UPI001966E7D3|nr:ABC transporter permease [Methylococcus sp. EFPC2]QSA98154.1 ABC transporter permease [Methylococcus sp. EFPC2]